MRHSNTRIDSGLAPFSAALPLSILLTGAAMADPLKPVELTETDELVLSETNVKASAIPKNARLADPVPKSGIGREEFEARNNRRTGDIVKRLSGALVDEPGESKDVKLRGMDKEYTRVQVDGVQLPNGGEKREFQVNQLPSFMVGEVNVIRNSSAEYESDGIAGRVDIKTRQIPTTPKLEARFGYGGRNDMDGDLLNGQIGFGYKPVDWFGGMGSFDHLDNLLDKNKDKRFSTGKRELEKEVTRSHSSNVMSDLGLFYDDGEFHAKPMLLNTDFDKTKSKFNSEPNKAGSSEFEAENTNQSTAGSTFTHKHGFGGGQVWESLFAYYSSSEDKNKDKLANKETAVNSGKYKLDKSTRELENKTDQTWNLNTALRVPFTLGFKQEFKFGGAFRERERFRDKTALETNSAGVSKNTTGPKDNYRLTEDYFAGFLQDNLWLRDDFSLMPGLRIEHVELRSSTGDGKQSGKSVTDLNPSFHMLFRPRNDTSLRFAFSKSVNRPKFDELSPFEQDRGTSILIGSPDLNPARSQNFDVGGEYAGANLFFAANFFHKFITGVIEEVDSGRDQDGKDVFQVQNVGDGWTHGIELEQRLGLAVLDVNALRDVQVWANQTLLESRLTEASGKSRPFKQQPGFIANIGVDYRYAPWGSSFTAALNYIAERPEYKANGDVTTVESAVTLDVSARQRLYQGLSMFFEADNLTGENKVDIENLINGSSTRKVETYGRTFMVGLNLQY
ncbi:MAG: TonB-dependent receptor [Methylomonas sp.]|nr:TonB-dependent receptor [Methylomonas sp.]